MIIWVGRVKEGNANSTCDRSIVRLTADVRAAGTHTNKARPCPNSTYRPDGSPRPGSPLQSLFVSFFVTGPATAQTSARAAPTYRPAALDRLRPPPEGVEEALAGNVSGWLSFSAAGKSEFPYAVPGQRSMSSGLASLLSLPYFDASCTSFLPYIAGVFLRGPAQPN